MASPTLLHFGIFMTNAKHIRLSPNIERSQSERPLNLTQPDTVGCLTAKLHPGFPKADHGLFQIQSRSSPFYKIGKVRIAKKFKPKTDVTYLPHQV